MIEVTNKEAATILAASIYGIYQESGCQSDWATHINDSLDVECRQNTPAAYRVAISKMGTAQLERLLGDVTEALDK